MNNGIFNELKGESIKTKFIKYLNSIEYLPYEQQIDMKANMI